jgi:hypothetical protein
VLVSCRIARSGPALQVLLWPQWPALAAAGAQPQGGRVGWARGRGLIGCWRAGAAGKSEARPLRKSSANSADSDCQILPNGVHAIVCCCSSSTAIGTSAYHTIPSGMSGLYPAPTRGFAHMNRLIFASALLSASGGTGYSEGPMHRAGTCVGATLSIKTTQLWS